MSHPFPARMTSSFEGRTPQKTWRCPFHSKQGSRPIWVVGDLKYYAKVEGVEFPTHYAKVKLDSMKPHKSG